MMKQTVLALLATATAGLGGCADQEADSPDDGASVVDGKGDGVTEFTIKLTTSSGVLRAADSPKLPGAPSGTTKFSCPDDTRTDEGWRLLCSRGSEQLRLTYDEAGRVGAAIFVKAASQPDKRNFYHCDVVTATAGKWPSEIKCKYKAPLTNISGQLVSPFSSSIEDIGILNSHLVSTSGSAKLYRGMKPFRDSDVADLETLGVKAVLIFKKPTGATEVDDETDALAPIGVTATNILNEEFLWKDFADFETPCRQTVRSLEFLHEKVSAGKNTFFHCTVGEDRTGYLAGLYRLLTETTPITDVFETEMCARGYSSGNPQKPYGAVAREVDSDLTPIFLKMAFKISQGELSPTSLDEDVCAEDPANDAAFTGDEYDPTKYRCTISPRYRL